MSAAIILPYEQEKGQDSSRVIAVSHVDCSGRPKVLVTREQFGGRYLLRFPGGKLNEGESPYAGALRELGEETHYLKGDLDIGLIHLFTLKDEAFNHNTHVFVCGFRETPKIKVRKKEGNVSSRHWVHFSCPNSLGNRYIGPYNCSVEQKHLTYLREAIDTHNILGVLLSCYNSKRKTKKAS